MCDICWLFYDVLYVVIIGIAGSTDNSKVEMFNGDRELHLRVIKEKDQYCVRVAKRPNVSVICLLVLLVVNFTTNFCLKILLVLVIAVNIITKCSDIST